MSDLRERLQSLARSSLSPIARMGRRLLTTAAKPTEFKWHMIEAGPAAGCQVILPSGAAITNALTAGTYERITLEVVCELVAEHDVCFDVGGHYGYFTLSLAKLARRGQVHTFEPVPQHADRIKEAAIRSGLEHVVVHQVAVAGEVGQMVLSHSVGDLGDDSMAYLETYGGVETPAAKEHYSRFSRTSVQTVTLDSLLGEGLRPQFIKIDAEGAEVEILKSALQMIGQTRPRMLIEVHGIYEAMGCAEILRRCDYRAILLTNQKTTMPILWVHKSDDTAVVRVASILGHDPIVMFD